MRRAILALSVCAAACQQRPEVARTANEAETRAIFAEITDGMRDPNSSFCVSRKISGPLEDQIRFASDNPKRKSWLTVLKLLWPVGSDDEAAAKNWTNPNIVERRVPVPLDTGKMLERRLRRALATHFGRYAAPPAERVLPAELLGPAGTKHEPCGGKAIEVSLSRPVIIDNTAFVETGSSCGGLCGEGDLEAYNLEHGRWHLIARKLTWMA